MYCEIVSPLRGQAALPLLQRSAKIAMLMAFLFAMKLSVIYLDYILLPRVL
jgi:hypothetical protein